MCVTAATLCSVAKSWRVGGLASGVCLRMRAPRRAGLPSDARAEHVKISDAAGLAFLEAYAAPLHAHELLFPSLACGSASASSSRYRKCWDAVYGGALGFPCRDGVGLTPASMRAGALTALYGAGAEPGRLQWHARHKSERTTRRYVQELGASVVLARLPAARREAIVELARTAPVLLRAVTAELSAPRRSSSPVTRRPAAD